MKIISLIFALTGLSFGQLSAQTDQETSYTNTKIMKTTAHYTFTLSDQVIRQKIQFKNRYGIMLSGDLYLPKNTINEKLPALAISGPFGAVKEQSSGLYANQMAQRGFAVLAFDPSYTGESAGEPRNLASPEINTEDFSAAVDYLGWHKNVDRTKIGIIGICGFGGFALNATAVDKRVKAVAATSLYDMTRVMSKGYNDVVTPEQRAQTLDDLSQQRWTDAQQGKPTEGQRNLPEKLKGDEAQFVKEYFDYYRTSRGFHARSLNSNGAWLITNPIAFMNMPILKYVNEISPRPMLLIAGEKAHSRYFSEDIYQVAAEPKELMIIPNAVHVDLYDQVELIPFEKLDHFFKTHLK
ncbi:alpha/beta hydrolase [Sphingobacterium faecium]|uniref:alpha/beta hydrolase n=1 Tax=Sphingobacterium faecium TaxID=34087 RepID=UPI001292A980|nr:alpha/beta hydrolase [Sphingobacterium faecium]MQP28858.1 alpha/beta hydrolase [Sphingobacterium faecium]